MSTLRPRWSDSEVAWNDPNWTWNGVAWRLTYANLLLRNDDADLYSRVTVEREGGTEQVAESAAAAATYGPRILARTSTLSADDAESLGAALYLLSKYEAPATRPQSLQLLGSTADAAYTQILNRRPGDRITVERHPPGGGSAIDLDAIIEGFSHEITPGQVWITTWNLVPAELAYWLLEDATYGELGISTRLGF